MYIQICIASDYGVFHVQVTPMTASGRMTIWRGAESTGASTYSSLTFPPTVLYLTYLFSRVYRDVIFNRMSGT